MAPSSRGGGGVLMDGLLLWSSPGALFLCFDTTCHRCDSLHHVSGGPMTCVLVPAVTPLPTPCNTKNPYKSLLGNCKPSFLRCFICSLLQVHTKLSGCHTKDRNLQLHTNTLGCVPVFKVESEVTWKDSSERGGSKEHCLRKSCLVLPLKAN